MSETLPFFLVAWTLMMTAMMLPSVVPLVLLYGRSARRVDQALLAFGYLAVWSATGPIAYAADMTIDLAPSIVLLAAAAYELTPIKAACLRHCRAQVDFLVMHWRSGRFGAVRLGVAHGLYCVGCCWALMAVLVLAAAMSLVWAAVLAVAVTVQKVLPAPRWSSLATAFGLAGAAVVVAVD